MNPFCANWLCARHAQDNRRCCSGRCEFYCSQAVRFAKLCLAIFWLLALFYTAPNYLGVPGYLLFSLSGLAAVSWWKVTSNGQRTLAAWQEWYGLAAEGGEQPATLFHLRPKRRAKRVTRTRREEVELQLFGATGDKPHDPPAAMEAPRRPLFRGVEWDEVGTATP